GYARSAFMLTLAEPPQVGRRAYAGVGHGAAQYALEEYFERWADSDALTSEAARSSFRRTGHATIAGVYPKLDRAHRRFVDDFLRRIGAPHQLSYRLAAGWTEGYLTVMRTDEYCEHDEAILARLAPHLTDLLRERLP